MNTRITSRSAFTLLELLVVLAVIGILLGVVATYTSGAKEKARSVECKKNLGDWAKGLGMLVDDSRTHSFPAAGSGAAKDEKAWYNTIARYVDVKPLKDYEEGEKMPVPNAGIKSVYVCPAANNRTSSGDLFSYSYNSHLNPDGKTLRASNVKNASELVAFMDAPRASAYSADETMVLSETTDSFRHGGMMNIAFCDGHVGSFKKHQVLQGSETPSKVNNFGILWDPSGESEN